MQAARSATSGIVLAGGAGRRMGRPKGALSLYNRPVILRASEILRPWCDYVCVVSRPEVDLPVLPAYAHALHDLPGPDAPLTGIVTGLAGVPGDDVLVLACDMPFAAPALEILAAAPAGVALMAAAHGRAQPLCARYPRTAALAVGLDLLAAGETRAMALPRALGAAPTAVPANSLANLNTPRDLAAAERRLSRVPS